MFYNSGPMSKPSWLLDVTVRTSSGIIDHSSKYDPIMLVMYTEILFGSVSRLFFPVVPC